MANKITQVVEWKESGGLSKIKSDIASAEGLTGKLKAGWKSFGEELKTNRQLQAGIAAGAAGVAAASVKAASDLGESINAVNVAYGQAGDEVLKLGENSATAFGLSKRAFNEFSTQFSAFATNIAQGEGKAVEQVVGDLTTRLADFASVYNVSLEEAAQVAQSTLAGETESFRRFGGDVSAASVELYALRNGLVDNKSEMTEAIKVQARYGLFMEQTAKVAGDFANTQDSLANQQRIARAQAEDLAAQLGTVLIPVFAEATQAANDYAAGLQNIIDAAGDVPLLGDIVGDNPGEITGRVRRLIEISNVVTNPGAKAGEAAVKGLAGGVRDLAGAFGIGGDAAEDFGNKLGQARDRARDAQAQQQAYVDLLRGQHIAAVQASEAAIEAATAAQDAYVRSLEAMHVAARDGFGGTRDEAFRLGSALEDLADKFDKSGDKAEDASVGMKAYDGVLSELAGTLDKVQNNLDEMNGALDAQSDALDLADSLQSIADAELELSEAIAEHGENSVEADRAQRNLSRATIGYYRNVLDLIESLGDVPSSKLTEIKVAMQQGDVDRVEALINDITRDRYIRATVVPVKQNSFDQALINIAQGTTPTGPTYTNPTPAPTASAIAPTTSTQYVDNSRTTIVYPVGTTPRTGRTDSLIEERRNGVRP